MKPALFALSAFLSVMLISGCQKKQEPGKTVVTGYGTVYTVQMIGNRNYHHSSQVRQPNGSLLFTNLPDTTFSFQYVNDGEVMFGADHLFFSISNSFNTNVVYKNLNIDQSMQENVTFDISNNTITISKFQSDNSGINFIDSYHKF